MAETPTAAPVATADKPMLETPATGLAATADKQIAETQAAAPRTEASTDERIRAYLAEIALLRDRIEDLKMLTDEFRVWVRDLTEQRDRAEVRAAELDKRLLAYQPPVPALPPRVHDGGAGSRADPPEHRLISRGHSIARPAGLQFCHPWGRHCQF